ncbi:LamG domain-containing protein [Methanoregula sp.]|uniref:LamG domain-containing protein n=1 Tax=Methanoregula sp. TaxID=2052170 RepID=UPI002B6A1316|nr:LamG domain-containing protein [Methanoregula sp.]HVP96402.1 LamG domain-containing protein [Methanoregula sp.]
MTVSCRRCHPWLFWGCIAILLLFTLPAAAASDTSAAGPTVYLNFNEGGGNLALDSSGHGNAGMIHGNAYRIDNNGCVRALVLDGNGSYVSVAYTAANHPTDAITVSLWFSVNDTYPQALVSTNADGGGYRLGFDEGNDLWWTLGLDSQKGSVSVVIPHEAISPGQWHQVTGSYDGSVAQIYLDGILRNQVNATGAIRYTDNNAVMIGANAGPADIPDTTSPGYLAGAVDEVRIYDRALSYGEEMDDRYQCTAAPGTGILLLPAGTPPEFLTSGSLGLQNGETATRRLTFANQSTQGIWQVSVPPGSRLSAGAADAYPDVYADEWYVELRDQDTRLTRIVAFPSAINAPASGVIESGNATVLLHYFGGPGRFPAAMNLILTCTAPENPVTSLPKAILEYPTIVIYSASWATLIALIVVIIWAHRRQSKK